MRNEEAYLKRRVQSWKRLELLCDKGQGSFKKLSGLEVVEFVRLYRQTSADLAYLMTHSSNQDVVEHLNRLVGRAYGLLYKSPTKALWQVLDEWLYLAASTMRRNSRWFWLATGLFFAMTFLTFGLMSARPDLRHHFVSPMAEQNHEYWMTGEHESRGPDGDVQMAAFYASNNPMAGIQAVSIGAATAGVGSMYVLWVNAKGTGALAADMASVGHLPFLIISIAPHGISEIGGFMVADAIGLMFAWAILVPGRRTRASALKHVAKDGFVMYMLALVMILMAAPIEGFFSFNPLIPLWLKAVVATLAFAGWTLFFTQYGIDRDVEAYEKDAGFRLAAD